MAYDRSEWELSEYGNLIETENEKYGEIIQIAERRRTAEKYVKIRKIRQEMTWGVRLTKTLVICYCGPYVAYRESILAELIPPFQFYLRDKQFYSTYKGTPFRLPDGYTFKFYENAVECWHHNAILSDEKQLKILVRYNFDKFVRALETIGEPTAVTVQYDYDTCVSSISPFSESEDEEGETDDEDERSEGEEQDHSISKIFPFSFSGDEESEFDEEDERSEGEEKDHSINKIFPFSFTGDEESESDSKSDCSDESKSVAGFDDGFEPVEEEEHDQSDDDLPMMVTRSSESDNEESESYYESDDEDEHSEGEKQDNSIVEIYSFSESVYEESESDWKSDFSDEYKSVAEFDHEDESDEEEEHDQSDDQLPMMVTPSSESTSDDEENESYNESDDEDEQSEEELDHHSDEITENQEEMCFPKEEDNDKKFDLEDVPILQLLHCGEKISQKCDPEEFDLGILFSAEEHDHNLNLEKVATLCSLVEKVEPDDARDSEDEINRKEFNEIEAQGPPNQKQQQLQQQHCNEHMIEHRPNKNTKKRKNILMGWVCSKILKTFIKSKVLL